MAARFRKTCPELGAGVRFRTFHSFFLSVILDHAVKPPRILTGEEKETILQGISADLSYGSDTAPAARTGPAGEADRLKAQYLAYLRENNLIDYDAMITGCHSLLLESKEIRDYYRRKYTHILIDEFQDINRLQYDTVRLIVGEERNLFVVGDDDQAIYGFRGSDPAILRRMPEDFPGIRQIVLNLNYRCTGAINLSAQLIISGNRNRIPKGIRSARERGVRPRIAAFETAEEQYRFLREEIHRAGSSSVAVIFRSNAQLNAFSRYIDPVGKSLNPVNNEIVRVGKEISALISDYFLAAMDVRRGRTPKEPLLLRIMNRPRRFLTRETMAMNTPAMLSLRHELFFLGGLSSGRAWDYLFLSVGLQREFSSPEAEAVIPFLKQRILLSGSLAEAAAVLKNTDVRELSRIPLRKDGEPSAPPGVEGVSLLTYHRSKGLEFDVVFLPDLNDGILPSRRASGESDMEEERRLLYVGMTRARERLTLSYVRGSEGNPRIRSRFLEVFDLPPDIEKKS